MAEEALFAQEGQHRLLLPRHLVAQRVAQALRAATGVAAIRFHHLRHSFVCRLMAGCLSVGSLTEGRSIDAPALARELQLKLLGVGEMDRRVIWAISAVVGHSSPATTLKSYWHLGHALARLEMVEANWMVELPVTTPYVARLDEYGGEPPRPSALPPLPVIKATNLAPMVDKIVDLARINLPMDTICQLCLTHEGVVRQVLAAAKQDTKKVLPTKTSIWIHDRTTAFNFDEQMQINNRLHKAKENSLAMEVIRKHWIESFVPEKGLFVLSLTEELAELIQALKICTEANELELCLPGRPAPPEEIPRYRTREGRLLKQTHENIEQLEWTKLASESGIRVTTMERVPRRIASGRHQISHVRAGLRMREMTGGIN